MHAVLRALIQAHEAERIISAHRHGDRLDGNNGGLATQSLDEECFGTAFENDAHTVFKLVDQSADIGDEPLLCEMVSSARFQIRFQCGEIALAKLHFTRAGEGQMIGDALEARLGHRHARQIDRKSGHCGKQRQRKRCDNGNAAGCIFAQPIASGRPEKRGDLADCRHGCLLDDSTVALSMVSHAVATRID
ncbi:MAG TPA: hypothetical protein VKP01_05595 [Saliniramus sp.]|nr:hypothetical protein [Saliniramus sp.]HMB10049.1 hypothetical protein [Saliniramus sp.]